MTRPYRPAVLGAALLALAACGSEDKDADQRTAVGQILPGSASDAMIHYDQLRSQNPLAPAAGATGSAKAAAAAPAEDAGDAGAETESPAADASEPAGAATPQPAD